MSKREDFWAKLDEADGSFPAAISLEKEGQMVGGVITGFDQVRNQYADEANGQPAYTPVVLIALEKQGKPTGETGALYLNNTVLRNQFARKDPKVGERVGVKFVGEKKGARYSYKNFVVMVDRDETAQPTSFLDATGTQVESEEPSAPPAPMPNAMVTEPEDDLPW